MRACRFIPPTFKVVATDEGRNQDKWVTRADSEQELRQRLEEEGWSVESVEPYEFSTWQTDSQMLLGKVEEVLEKGESPKYSSKHWQQLKRHLFELFGGRCAYCEARILHVSSGDVEHYRPKARVDEDRDHPGYYWLAYDAENLLPACELCNRARGKMNQFPVEDGTRATDPDGIADERPLLLNPYLDHSPLEHLRFAKTGHVEGSTEKGKKSVVVYNLMRKDLRQERERAFDAMASDLDVAIFRKGLKEGVCGVVEGLRRGEREYSSALLSCVPAWLDERESAMANLREDLVAEG